MSKLFLSYNRADSEVVETVRELLAARGVSTFLDRLDLIPGEPWPQALERALGEAGAVAAFLGPDGLGNWQKREVSLSLARQAGCEGSGTAFPVIPVLLPGADPKAGFLFLNTWIDLRHDIRDPAGLEALERSVTGRTIPMIARADRAVVCPYRGLRAFGEEDAPFFFGREDLSEKLLETVLRGEPLITVVGPSGSGKSSVVRAGLVPLLRRCRPPEAAWDVLSFRPAARPFHRLAGALFPGLEPELSETDRLTELEKLGTALEGGHVRFEEVVGRFVERSKGTDRLLLVVDQFEEIFTLTPAERTRTQFVEMLLSAVAKVRVQVLLTLRGDFYGHAVGLSRDLSDRLQGAHLNVGPMRREELQRAVEEPARLVGLELEPGLVGKFLDDLEEAPGNLPLLEFALAELWNRRRNGRLTHEAYEEIGGVAEAMSRRADAEFQRLSGEEKRAARRLFTRLVRVARPDERADDIRRRASLGELQPPERTVVEKLASPGARLLVTGRDEITGEETVEVAHEALIRSWPSLRKWVDEDRELLLWRQRLQVRMNEWRQAGGDSGALLRGSPLTEAERWSNDRPDELNQGERLFIEASTDIRQAEIRRAERRKRVRRWAYSTVMAVLVALTMVLMHCSAAAKRRARALWATSLVNSAETVTDPLIGVLLLRELPEKLNGVAPPDRWITVARALAETPVPRRIWGSQGQMITSAVFSPVGRRVATGSLDGTIRVWRADDVGAPVVIDGQGSPVDVLAFSQDGSRLVAGYRDGTVRLWWADRQEAPVVLLGHRRSVGAAAFSLDGSRLVTGSADRTARVWQADGTGEPVVLRGYRDSVAGVTFSSDGSRALVVSDGVARIWPIEGAMEPAVVLRSAGRVLTADFSPDGGGVATGSSDGTVRLWRADGSGEAIALTGHLGAVFRVVFSPDGSKLATASQDGTARVWSTYGSGEPVVLAGHRGVVSSVAFSSDGLRVVTTSSDGTARIWHADGSGEPLVLGGHEGRVRSASFDRDGSNVMTISTDGTARWWGTRAPLEPVLMDHEAVVNDASFSPDGSWIATASLDGAVRVWRADGSAAPIVLRGHQGGVTGVRFSPDGTRIVSASLDGTARAWRTDGSGRHVVLTGHRGAVWAASFSPDGSRIVTASSDATARVWRADGSGSRESVVLRGHSDRVTSASFSPDGSQVVTASVDGTARVWQADGSGETIVLEGHEDQVTSASFSPDGLLVVTASEDGTVRVWRSNGKRTPLVLKGYGRPVRTAAFSPDGTHVVAASVDHAAFVWRTDGEGARVTLEGHWDAVLSAAFSPDGSRVVTASVDGTSRVWRSDGSDEPIVLSGHRTSLRGASFSSDGNRVVTFSGDGTARVWTVSWPALRQQLRSISAGSCLTARQRMKFLSESEGQANSYSQECRH